MMTFATRFFIISIIGVHQAKHMTKLMTDGANAINNGISLLFPSIQFGGTSIASQSDTIFPHPVIGLRIVYRTGMRPDITLIVSAIVRTITSKDKIDHVDHAVIITIIVLEIYL